MNIGVEEIGVKEFSEIVTWTGLIELRTHYFYLYKFQIRVFGKFQHMPENSKVPMIDSKMFPTPSTHYSGLNLKISNSVSNSWVTESLLKWTYQCSYK